MGYLGFKVLSIIFTCLTCTVQFWHSLLERCKDVAAQNEKRSSVEQRDSSIFSVKSPQNEFEGIKPSGSSEKAFIDTQKVSSATKPGHLPPLLKEVNSSGNTWIRSLGGDSENDKSKAPGKDGADKLPKEIKENIIQEAGEGVTKNAKEEIEGEPVSLGQKILKKLTEILDHPRKIVTGSVEGRSGPQLAQERKEQNARRVSQLFMASKPVQESVENVAERISPFTSTKPQKDLIASTSVTAEQEQPRYSLHNAHERIVDVFKEDDSGDECVGHLESRSAQGSKGRFDSGYESGDEQALDYHEGTFRRRVDTESSGYVSAGVSDLGESRRSSLQPKDSLLTRLQEPSNILPEVDLGQGSFLQFALTEISPEMADAVSIVSRADEDVESSRPSSRNGEERANNNVFENLRDFWKKKASDVVQKMSDVGQTIFTAVRDGVNVSNQSDGVLLTGLLPPPIPGVPVQPCFTPEDKRSGVSLAASRSQTPVHSHRSDELSIGGRGPYLSPSGRERMLNTPVGSSAHHNAEFIDSTLEFENSPTPDHSNVSTPWSSPATGKEPKDEIPVGEGSRVRRRLSFSDEG